MFLREVEWLICLLINQADVWHFDIIGIGQCLCSHGQLKDKQIDLNSASVNLCLFEEMLYVAVKCTSTNCYKALYIRPIVLYCMEELAPQFFQPACRRWCLKHPAVSYVFLCVSPDMSIRNGTDVDAGIAVKTFSELGYKIKIANDQTVDKMHELMSSGNKKYSFFFSQQRCPLWMVMGMLALKYRAQLWEPVI